MSISAMARATLLTALLQTAGVTPGVAQDAPAQRLAQTARACKQVSSCREAVELWCGGYRRADADHDGIPCENVCDSKDEVDEIRAEIGC